MKICWQEINEKCLVDNIEAFKAERQALQSAECPDWKYIDFLGREIVGRQEAIIEADVSPETAEWLKEKAKVFEQ